jgi:protoporphyrinogen oxidase
MTKRIVIIGAGPAGLGAGLRLSELGYENWALYERHDYVGGHASSFVDEHGFTWDEGGHVIFSHFPYFDHLIDTFLGKEFHERVRESWIVTGSAWVPYPFQNNLRYLPKEAQVECLLGAARVWGDSGARRASNFRDWILATFGEGIASHFMFPYNAKVWTTPLEEMSKGWIAERVAVVDFKRLLQNVVCGRDDFGWGPNSRFKFPLHGGTGEIYRRAAASMGDHVKRGKELVEVDARGRRVSFADGTGDTFDALISTAPVDLLVKLLKPPDTQLAEAASHLRHNNLLVVGVGVEKKLDTTKCWIYFPEPQIPFYRATFFSNYSPFNVPNGDVEHYGSLMCEVSCRPGAAINHQEMMERTLAGLIQEGLLEPSDRNRVISRYTREVPYSYPIPTLDRDAALEIILPALLKLGIYSRGRFGAWRYEVGNMDHAVMMGAEAVSHILDGEPERTVHANG